MSNAPTRAAAPHNLLALWPTAPAAAQSRERCFAETDYCAAGRTHEFCEGNGGLKVFGCPITTGGAARARPNEVDYILPQGRELLTMVSCCGDKEYAGGEVVDMRHRLITIAEPVES